MDAAQDCQGITVHVASFGNEGTSVFYASMPCGPCVARTHKGCGVNGAGAHKIRLISVLWDQLVAMESSVREHCQSSNRAALNIQIVHGPLGRPQLLWGDYGGPAISFSEGGGKVWAALCGDESEIGIDVSEADEFKGEYPYRRAFHAQELQHALKVAGGDLEKASALLWSIKEATVKALGCAFHLVDPLEIYVYPPTGEEGEYTFPVGLSRKTLARVPTGTGRSLWVRSLPHVKMWLSIALLT